MSKFDPEKWIRESCTSDDAKTVEVAGEEVKIRRLMGTQWEQYIHAVQGRNEASSVVTALQYGLVKGFGQYTYEEMEKFYNSCPMLADKIAVAILEHTQERFAAELKALEDAEKNSETTPTSLPSGDGVESTGKTPKKPKSAEQNC